MRDRKETARDILISGLRNAHAAERQAVATLGAQVDRLEDYPEFQVKVREHIEVSREQEKRLDIALRKLDASTSVLKSAAMSVMGAAQSALHNQAEDAPLKQALSTAMFEHFEIATYSSLIALAQEAGETELIADLEASLKEEKTMAAWMDDNIPAIARRYVEMEMKAGREQEQEDKKREHARETFFEAKDHSLDQTPGTAPKDEPKTAPKE
jgi:ferritin-like metal-binding protein YciE